MPVLLLLLPSITLIDPVTASLKASYVFTAYNIIKEIYIAQVHKGHKCAMFAEMAVWLRVCLCLYSYLKNGKVFPYSLPIVGPGADPSVQAVSPQVT